MTTKLTTRNIDSLLISWRFPTNITIGKVSLTPLHLQSVLHPGLQNLKICRAADLSRVPDFSKRLREIPNLKGLAITSLKILPQLPRFLPKFKAFLKLEIFNVGDLSINQRERRKLYKVISDAPCLHALALHDKGFDILWGERMYLFYTVLCNSSSKLTKISFTIRGADELFALALHCRFQNRRWSNLSELESLERVCLFGQRSSVTLRSILSELCRELTVSDVRCIPPFSDQHNFDCNFNDGMLWATDLGFKTNIHRFLRGKLTSA